MISIFNSVTGVVSKIVAQSQQSQACIRVDGLEFVFEVSRTCLQELPQIGSEATLYTWLYHRDDQMYFCGFKREEERSMFMDLLKVEGIGPRQALKVLSSVNALRLAQLLDAGDVEGLETLPGLGKKTAQKMVLALKGKLNVHLIDAAGAAKGVQTQSLGPYEDILTALVAMGYDRKSVLDVLKRLIPEYESLPMIEQERELMRRTMIELG